MAVINAIVLGLLCYVMYNLDNKEVTSPVEEIQIDSVIEHNHNIKVTIERLEDEKVEVINKVYTLDNDSTIKLFYKLLSE